MNKLLGVIVVIIIVAGGAYFIANNTHKPETSTINKSGAKGRVVFSVTDAAMDMSTISQINMKVSKVEMHSETGSWATVSTTPRNYDLLALNASNKSELLADVKAEEGTYDQVRLMVDSISVKTKSGTTSEAKLPSGVLKIDTKVVVADGSAASVNFDFLADKSLHTTGSGKYIFAPVVKTEVKSDATVNIGLDSAVNISGGDVEDSNTVGMDVDGSVKANFNIKTDEKLEIDANNAIKVNTLIH